MNLDGLNQNKQSEKAEIFKIEEKGMDALNSLQSSSETDDDDFSPQNSQQKVVRGFNVSPSSMVEGKRSRAADDQGSLNSSRMTGT